MLISTFAAHEQKKNNRYDRMCHDIIEIWTVHYMSCNEFMAMKLNKDCVCAREKGTLCFIYHHPLSEIVEVQLRKLLE